MTTSLNGLFKGCPIRQLYNEYHYNYWGEHERAPRHIDEINYKTSVCMYVCLYISTNLTYSDSDPLQFTCRVHKIGLYGHGNTSILKKNLFTSSSTTRRAAATTAPEQGEGSGNARSRPATETAEQTSRSRSRSSNRTSRRATETTEQRARRLAVRRDYQREYRRR